MKFLSSLVAGFCLFITGCGHKPSDYQNEAPALDLRHFLDGELEAWGMIQYPNGRVVKRITGTMKAHWQDENTCIMDESFLFSDGERKTRQWVIRKTAEGRYSASASDAAGDAAIEIAGNAMRWNYRLNVPVDGSEYVFTFDDWMFLIDERSMLNRATMTKFGIPVGELTFFFRKKES